MTLRLYDLAGAEPDRRFSPYCWRTRMALAHKQLAYETIPWRFTEKGAIASSGQKLVPVMVDGDRWIADSWIIANHLEDTYPDNPSLFGDSGARALTRHYSNIADGVVGAIFPFIALDILDHIAEPDRAYFRESREKRLGMPLETFVAPNSAVQSGPRGLFTWVVGGNNTVEQHPIEVGPAAGDLTIVAAGLTEGDRVVTAGQYKLQAKAPVVVASLPSASAASGSKK
jgi:glutathione S-transferase